MRPRRPGLLVHTFLPAGSAATRSTLQALWRAVADLAMDQPIGTLPLDLPEDLPADPTADREPLVVLAARRRLVPGAIQEALAYRVHDVIAVSVLQAPNDDDVGWVALQGQWAAVRPPLPAAVGTVQVYLGQWPTRAPLIGRSASAARRVARLAAQVPDAQETDWYASWCRTSDGLLLWELPPAAEPAVPADRRLLAMSEARDESTMDRWTWFSRGLVLPPLTRYLLHAARLRHQRAVLTEALPGLRDARRRTEDDCGELAALLRTDDPPVEEVLAATQALGMVRTERGGLIAAWADANDMAQTVRAAHANLVSAFDVAPRCQRSGPLEVDREIVSWMTDQLATELTYLDSAQRKAQELTQLAAAVIDERQRQRRETLALLQASVLSALLMALAAIQSLEYKVPLPGSLMAPLIALLATAALVLPAAALLWPDRGNPHRPPRRRRYVAAAGALGASFGWLVVSIGWRAVADRPAPVSWAVAGAGIAVAMAGIAAAVLVGARRREIPKRSR
jgi:hypothetical protein